MKIKKYIFTIAFFIGLFFLCNSKVYAGDLELKNLDYDVQLNTDGSANVTETWVISIEDTNTLFKTFEIDKSKYSEISDVSVIETTNGSIDNFEEIYVEKYHVDKNCFYALINSKGQFEIAWGVHENNYARRTFKINYTIIDAIKNYKDCSEFYWQFISTESSIPADYVTGTITLPTNVTELEDLRVWAHGPLNGNITKVSANTVNFEVKNLNRNTMLEARVVTPIYVFSENQNTSSVAKLNSILSQEQEWADEANKERERRLQEEKTANMIMKTVIIGLNIVGLLLGISFIKKIKKYKEELKNAPEIKPTMQMEYYRDIPNENATPAQAAFLYYFKTSNFSTHISNYISATMLDLCMKKYLTFDITGNKKNEIKISLQEGMEKELLPKDEKVVYEILEKVSKDKQFTMKDFEKYCKNHSSTFLKKYNEIEPSVKDELENQKLYDKETIKKYEKYVGYGVAFIILAVFSIPLMILDIIPAIICSIYCFKVASKYNTLTQKGTDEKEEWKGLKKYMEDFSLMKEKEVPELILWEKYLVYATAFGISDKVLKQLKVIYPQMLDEDYMRSNGYSYLYWMHYGNISNNFIHSINTSVSSTYNSVNYSSGSGSGGGFSGGGGFGGGGGRNGRKITLEKYNYI